MFKKIIILSAILAIISAGIIIIQPVYSAGLIPEATGQVSEGCQGDATYCGDYRVQDFVSLAVLISQWILGIVGSLSLVMFIYGGVTFLISAGSSDKVSQAKKIIVASIIGLVIVFSSWLIIKFVTDSIGVTSEYQFDGSAPSS